MVENEFPEKVQSHGLSREPVGQVTSEIQVVSRDKVWCESWPGQQQQPGVAGAGGGEEAGHGK